MFCPNCGKELKNYARFCPACGEQVRFDSPHDSKANRAVSDEPVAKAGKEAPVLAGAPKGLLPMVAAFALVAVVAVIGVISISARNAASPIVGSFESDSPRIKIVMREDGTCTFIHSDHTFTNGVYEENAEGDSWTMFLEGDLLNYPETADVYLDGDLLTIYGKVTGFNYWSLSKVEDIYTLPDPSYWAGVYECSSPLVTLELHEDGTFVYITNSGKYREGFFEESTYEDCIYLYLESDGWSYAQVNEFVLTDFEDYWVLSGPTTGGNDWYFTRMR